MVRFPSSSYIDYSWPDINNLSKPTQLESGVKKYCQIWADKELRIHAKTFQAVGGFEIGWYRAEWHLKLGAWPHP
jgi:hypothetical protein